MVQKQTRRRSSLVMGALLALLLGMAAAFFVFAVPIHMLEAVTTTTRLSRLMVQAEPPISPNDRMLLAVLAGILTTGIGWVLVDWLLFGRAGMRTLIREREDDYEDEDGDAFRPTDPLDLVAPVSLPTGDWNPPTFGDTRRPLSARTDIGDPPRSGMVFGESSGSAPGIDQQIPPINQIFPGAMGSAAAAPPPFQAPSLQSPLLQSIVPPPLFPTAPAANPTPGVPQAQGGAGLWGAPESRDADGRLPASWPQLDLPGAEAARQEIATRSQPAVGSPLATEPIAGMPSWLPAPGLRPELEQPVESSIAPVAPILPEPITAPVEPAPPAPIVAPQPVPPLQGPAPAPAPVQFSSGSPAAPEAFLTRPGQQVVPPQHQAHQPPVLPAPAQLPAIRTSSEPGFDRARLEDLLAKLERGLQNRRSLAAPALQAPTSVPRAVPPAGYAAPPPVAPPPANVPATPPVDVRATPPAFPQPQPEPLLHAYTPSSPQPLPAAAASQAFGGSRDDLLDQPLHVTLDLLRSMVKR